ncbi:hypothetical protein LTR84_003516 [Exophiala bonariae]|uniref:Peptidase A1 domain-containing protein n=1 Tax=Exophiala bonariae TaxID=1690606 RepID=A0AAV9NAX5_9EURO|nr:hypothetical protein LTR84_003516 [Exophiala bonariae]
MAPCNFQPQHCVNGLLHGLAASIPSYHNTSTAFLEFINDTRGDTWNLKVPRYNDAFLNGETSYPAFVESSHPEDAVTDSEIDDTGPVIRASLPLVADDGWTNLLGFRGNGTIYDARYACIQPEFQGLNFSGSSGPYPGDLSLSGSVRPVRSLGTSLILPPDNRFTKFGCRVISDGKLGNWPMTVCILDPGVGGFLSAVDPSYNTSLHYDYVRVDAKEGGYSTQSTAHEFDHMLNKVPIPVGPAYLILNMTNTSGYSIDTTSFPIRFGITEDWQLGPHSQWLSMTSSQPDSVLISNDTGDLVPVLDHVWSIDATLCYGGFYDTKTIYIEADRIRPATEPITLSQGLHQTGASVDSDSEEDRGIFQLS